MTQTTPNQSARILIVDDNDDVRYQLTRRLKKLSYTDISIAEDGQEAVDKIAREEFDLVLLDILMPGMTGYDVLNHLRSNGLLVNLPVIVISALDDMDSTVRCLQIGAEDYLPKPFNATLLEARIRGTLEKKQLRDEVHQQLKVIREIFGRYVPDKVAEEIVAGHGILQPTKTTATILYTDIAGFTGIVESIPPERVVEMLNEYFEAIIEPILEFGGTVNQFQGDAMLVTFNVPSPDENHVTNAVKAALAIQNVHRVKTFADIPLKTRIGINTGEVIAGNIGSGERMNYTVHGDAVNLAARLEQLNKNYDTNILVSQTTVDELQDKNQTRFVDDVEVSGKSTRVRVYTVT